MNEVYISIDVEADGPIPGVNSMLSLGAAAYVLSPIPVNPECPRHHYGQPDGACICQGPGWKEVGVFSANLKPLPDAVADKNTMDWWETQPEAWAEATRDPESPGDAMRRFKDWVLQFDKPLLVGWPVLYDGMWVYWYTIRFTGYPAPFGHQGLDIREYAWGILGGKYRDINKRSMPKRWLAGAPRHTHKALDDARGQGILFMNMLAEARSK